MLISDLCDFSDPYIVLKGNIIVDKKKFTSNDFDEPNIIVAIATATIMQIIMSLVKRSWFLKIMHHLSIAPQKLIV